MITGDRAQRRPRQSPRAASSSRSAMPSRRRRGTGSAPGQVAVPADHVGGPGDAQPEEGGRLEGHEGARRGAAGGRRSVTRRSLGT